MIFRFYEGSDGGCRVYYGIFRVLFNQYSIQYIGDVEVSEFNDYVDELKLVINVLKSYDRGLKRI